MSRIVVSDSACLIGLERVQRLELLAAVFGEVIIPPMVAAVAPVIAELRRQNFFISAPLVAEVLARCGETMD